MDERLTGAARLEELTQIKAARKRKDRIIEMVLLFAACVSVFTTLGIVYVLLKETLLFFTHVSV
ncbi:MAG: hypothetical protein ACOYNF_02755 [Rhodoferax sp.]